MSVLCSDFLRTLQSNICNNLRDNKENISCREVYNVIFVRIIPFYLLLSELLLIFVAI